MAKNKTQPNKLDVITFLNSVDNDQKREDCFKILNIMQEITQEKPVMWGTSIVGFGTYHYKYESGREGDFFLSGFSPRKQNITLYIMGNDLKNINICEKNKNCRHRPWKIRLSTRRKYCVSHSRNEPASRMQY